MNPASPMIENCIVMSSLYVVMYGYLYFVTTYPCILGHTDTCNYSLLLQLQCRLHVDNHDPHMEMFFDSSHHHSLVDAASPIFDAAAAGGGPCHLNSENTHY